MKNHSKETKNVSKNDYGFTQEKCKGSIFHNYLSRKKRGMGDVMLNDLSGDEYIPSYNFEVRLGLVIKINFANISNIASQKEFDIIADGGNTDRMYFGEKPKRRPDTITFSRGLTVEGYADMLSWLAEGLKVDDIMILVKKDRIPSRIFYIEQGILTKITFSDLDAMSSRIMIKTMEMQHTGVVEIPV